MKRILAGILAFACSATFAQDKAASPEESSKQKLQSWNLALQQGRSRATGYYAHFIKQDGKWAVKAIAEYAPTVKDFDSEEVLVFSNELQTVQPDFRDMKLSSKSEVFICTTGMLRTKGDNARTAYNPCDSSLTKINSLNVGTNLALTVFSLGISAATGTTTREVIVDPEKVVKLLEETQAIDQIIAIRQQRWLTRYHTAFERIRSTKDIDLFVYTYASEDPENLVPQANSMREQIIAKENEQKRAAEARILAARQAKALAEEQRERERIAHEKERAAQELAAQKRRDAITAEFRKTIKIGSDTFCGPVIAIRGPMIQIAARALISGYSAEPWLKITEVFPASIANCSNLNGRVYPDFF